MKYVPNAVINHIQEINHLADILSDLCNEKPTDKLLAQIKTATKRIKKISEGYNV